MIRYIQKIEEAFKDEVELCETKSIKKPAPEAGYEIKRAMVRVPGTKRIVKGWIKKPKRKKTGKVKGMTRSQRKVASRKAQKTKKADIKGKRLAKKRSAATRKATKRAGLSKK